MATRTVACCSMVALLALAAAVGRTDALDQVEAAGTMAGAETDQAARAKSGGDAENLAAALLRGLRGGAAGGPSAALGVFVARNYKKMAQTILPLLVGFKATGLLVAAMAITKFILLKALFLSTTALLVAAIMVIKKFLSSASQPHDAPAMYTYQHQDLSHLPYLHPHTAAAEYMDASQAQMPQVTYIGGSYGLQSIPYAATAGGLGHGLGDDAQGLYSSHSGSAAALSQLQQLQQLQQQALLAQQLGNATTQQQQQQLQQQQAGQLLQLSRRRLSAPQGATASSPYPYRPNRPEARPA